MITYFIYIDLNFYRIQYNIQNIIKEILSISIDKNYTSKRIV